MIHKSILKSVIHDIGELLNITCILISHDPLDTLSWADEILVMRNGHIIQQGSPENIYHHPVDTYIAGLFGKYNLLDEAIVKNWLNENHFHFINDKVMIRPEKFKISSVPNKGIKGKIKNVIFLGSAYEVEVETSSTNLILRTPTNQLEKGAEVHVGYRTRNKE